MIIIPDIHGRTFWKDMIKGRENEDIVFLGDYLDPYYSIEREITQESMWNNFLEIIDFKKTHPDTVTLLLGNHDLGYMIGEDICSSRRDRMNAKRNHDFFNENADLFKIAHSKTINGRTFLFSHAGIHKGWFDIIYLNSDVPKDDICGYLNDLFTNNRTSFLYSLSIFSHYRGWTREKYGSCIWADVREWTTNEPWFDGDVFQIFGHSQLIFLTDEEQKKKDAGEPYNDCSWVRKAVISDRWACLDCSHGFQINEETAELTPIDPSFPIINNTDDIDY